MVLRVLYSQYFTTSPAQQPTEVIDPHPVPDPLHLPPTQVAGGVQLPQLPPQPSEPQFFPVQLAWQAHEPVPEHTLGSVQVPQVPPHPSGPHCLPTQLG